MVFKKSLLLITALISVPLCGFDFDYAGPDPIMPEDIALRANPDQLFDSAPATFKNFTKLIKLDPMPTHLLPKGFIFYGPPGTGKTESAKALAKKSGFLFYSVSIADIGSAYVNQTARNLKATFDKIHKDLGNTRPGNSDPWDDYYYDEYYNDEPWQNNNNKYDQYPAAILFIDEIDSICGKRGGSSSHNEDDKTLSYLLGEIEGIYDSEKPIILIGATNRLDMIDSAIISRLCVVPIDLPNEENRFIALQQIMPLFFNGPTKLGDYAINYIAQNSEGMSYRDLNDIMRECAIKWYLTKNVSISDIEEIIELKYRVL